MPCFSHTDRTAFTRLSSKVVIAFASVSSWMSRCLTSFFAAHSTPSSMRMSRERSMPMRSLSFMRSLSCSAALRQAQATLQSITHELLQAAAVARFGRVHVPFRVGRDVVQRAELASHRAHAPEAADGLTVRARQYLHRPVGAVGDVDERLR